MQEELLATCSIQPGFVCSRKDIERDKKAFMSSGIFHEVRSSVVKRDGKVSRPARDAQGHCDQPKSPC
jgi:hypothetical protein